MQAQALLDAGHSSTIVIPLTTRLTDDAEPLRIRVKTPSGVAQDFDLLIDQLRAIDNRRLVKGPLTRLDRQLMGRVSEAIRDVLDFG